MYKIVVTKELARLLKEKRQFENIKANTLAEKLNINASYLSKIENGSIKKITPDLFEKIISNLFKDLSNDEAIKKIYESLEYWYSSDEIDQQLWFLNFDTVKRKIPLDKNLIQELIKLMQDNNISINNLLDRMNSNEALNEEQRSNQSYENNIWYIPNLKEPKLKIIKIHMSLEQLDEILNLKIDKTSFISVFCIAFYINKIIKFKDKISLSTEEYNKLTEETKQQLLKYNFSTLQDRNLRLKQAQNDEEFQAILSRFDKDNITIVNSILSAFKYASDLDVSLTNKRLSEFVTNLKWDIGFMLKIVSLNYRTNVDNFEKKKKLLEKIEELIKDYQSSLENSFSGSYLSSY